MIKYLKIFILLFFFLNASLICYSFAQNLTQEKSNIHLISLRFDENNSNTRLIAIFNQKPDFRLLALDQMPRLIIDLSKVQFSMPSQAVKLSPLINKVRFGKTNSDIARIVLEIKRPFLIKKAQIDSINDVYWQLTIDLTVAKKTDFIKLVEDLRQKNLKNPLKTSDLKEADENNFIKTLSSATQKKQTQKFTVVIDPGHGGIDTGAYGINGTLEKNVTLVFAKDLKAALEKTQQINVYLTRNDDIYLHLNERVKLARDYNANLLISIHADSIHIPYLRGATVYTLSDNASDSLAKTIAESQNKTDLLKAIPDNDPPEIADILIDLTRRETDQLAGQFANNVISSFHEGRIKVIKNPHRYAGFMVLKAPDFPSVLIELGYLSNQEDENLINNETWRRHMASILAKSILHFAKTNTIRYD